MRSIALIARTVTERKITDYRISYWKCILLTIPTLGIYNMVTYYKLMNRIHKHYIRQHMLYKDILFYLQEYAITKGKYMEELTPLKCEISDAEYDEGALTAGIWVIVSLITLGIGGLYPLYRLTVDPFKHDRLENKILNRISSILCDEEILKQPITKLTQCRKRTFVLYLFMTFLTLGLFSFYWLYVIISDFNKHFDEHDNWEATLLKDLSNF